MKKGFLVFVVLALLLSGLAACKQQRPPFLPPPEPAPPPEMGWSVKTDYSCLTSYSPLHTKHTRLHDGPLPELVPSDDYGLLLPYASAATLPGGGLRESKFGLVTSDGVIVTDLIYDGIVWAILQQYAYVRDDLAHLTAYCLTINIPGTEDLWGGFERKMAACARDGSWITPFDYVDIVFTEDVIVLLRSYDNFDIDVYDYYGQFVYNVMQMDWAGNIGEYEHPSSLVYGVSEGYASIQARNGGTYIVEMRTGKATLTNYLMVTPFSDGFASVLASVAYRGEYQSLWGFIDSNFDLVIPPRYSEQAFFNRGFAAVKPPDTPSQVINKRGETVFQVPEGYWIVRNYTGEGFTMHEMEEDGSPVYYTESFEEIRIPEIVRSSDSYYYIEQLGGGWYNCRTDAGAVLFTQDDEYFYEDVTDIQSKHGDALIYSFYRNDVNRTGVMMLDRLEIIPPEKDVTISPVVVDGTLKAYIVNTFSSYIYFGGPDPEYQPSVYRLVSAGGGTITSGSGILSYDEATGLYRVLGGDYFSWLDKDGCTIISIPNMASTMD